MLRLLTVVTLAFLGCSREEPIRVYTAPKPLPPTYAIVGAVFPQDDPVWFFKLASRQDEIERFRPAIDVFLRSIRFPNGPQNAPLWTLPEGWRLGGGDEFTAEKFLFGPEDRPLKLTMSQAKGGLDANLERWTGQLGLTEVLKEKDKYLQPLGTPPIGWRVEMNGPKNPAASRPMMAPR